MGFEEALENVMRKSGAKGKAAKGKGKPMPKGKAAPKGAPKGAPVAKGKPMPPRRGGDDEWPPRR